jgi:hypothetical protein
VAQDVHEEEAVLGAGPTRPVHDVGVGDAVDVGHAVAGVADDGHPGTRLLGRGDVTVADAEGGVLEEAVEVVVGEDRRGRDQPVVQRLLVVPVRRALPAGQEGRQVERVVVAVGARRQDVAKAAGVVGAIGIDGAGRGRREQRGERRGNGGRDEQGGERRGNDGRRAQRREQ